MNLRFGSFYQMRESYANETFMVSTSHGWRFVKKDAMFVLLKEEDEHYIVLLSDGELGSIYTYAKDLVPATP